MNPGNTSEPGQWRYMGSAQENTEITLEYCYGGSRDTGEVSGEYKIVGWGLSGNNVEIFDIHTNQWKAAAELGAVDEGNGYIVWRPDISFGALYNRPFNSVIRGVASAGHFYKRNVFKTFPLDDLDKMREIALTWRSGQDIELGIAFNKIEPFRTICNTYPSGDNYFKGKCCGLMLKTYQSDMFNNWVQTDYIDDPNTGIAAVTAVDTSTGKFTMDDLNLAKKVYDMLNRIAVSGGTFEDWQEAVYGEDAVRKVESPMFCGGYSTEVVFDEIVANTMSADGTPQGTLSGKGTNRYEKNGHCVIKCKEPSIIMIIASLTPRIEYNAQNEWYMTNLTNMDDIHKPSLDGIGFEDLMQERACWLGTEVDSNGKVTNRWTAGKIPAWLNYMTAVDEVHGEFADYRKCGWMSLIRRYDFDEEKNMISDFTTYIDPRKYNMAWGDTSMCAQNFWVQVGMHITARRKMSAKIIPNL